MKTAWWIVAGAALVAGIGVYTAKADRAVPEVVARTPSATASHRPTGLPSDTAQPQPGVTSDSRADPTAAAYERFRTELTSYTAARSTLPTTERVRRARALLQALPARLHDDQILPAEALVLTAVLAQDASANTATREALVAGIRAQVEQYAAQRVGPSPADDPRHTRYAQESARIATEVEQRVPAPQRQAVLSTRLQQLRAQLYDGAPAEP
ncbi:phospholipase C accessory protein PlcR [Ralstonia sp. R-29]|uniref:phospholipase C accessory protein PlcR n=1 Tax=Ralstonia sp. R-29 TaxID=3404059 RepID=UPI003CFAC81A